MCENGTEFFQTRTLLIITLCRMRAKYLSANKLGLRKSEKEKDS
jgi:hypothetical protein